LLASATRIYHDTRSSECQIRQFTRIKFTTPLFGCGSDVKQTLR